MADTRTVPAPTDADRALADTLLAALLPIKRRYPSLRATMGASSPAAITAAQMAVEPVLGDMTLSAAFRAHQSLYRILSTAQSYEDENTIEHICLDWAWWRLWDFLWEGPAATRDDVLARKQFVKWVIGPHGSGIDDNAEYFLKAYRVTLLDMDRLLSPAMPTPDNVAFGKWCVFM